MTICLYTLVFILFFDRAAHKGAWPDFEPWNFPPVTLLSCIFCLWLQLIAFAEAFWVAFKVDTLWKLNICYSIDIQINIWGSNSITHIVLLRLNSFISHSRCAIYDVYIYMCKRLIDSIEVKSKPCHCISLSMIRSLTTLPNIAMRELCNAIGRSKNLRQLALVIAYLVISAQCAIEKVSPSSRIMHFHLLFSRSNWSLAFRLQ